MIRFYVTLLTGVWVLGMAGVALADPPFLVPVGPPFTPPGRAVPIPASEILFGLGLAAWAWIGPKMTKQK